MKRYPGKYIVWSIGVLGVVTLGFVYVLAVSLTPNAQRFKANTPASALRP